MLLISLLFFYFFFYCNCNHRDLHSFPHDALPILQFAHATESKSLQIKVDQVGYPPGGAKIAIITSPAKTFEVKRSSDNTDRKSTRLNSSHANISYAVFCLKKKKINLTY